VSKRWNTISKDDLLWLPVCRNHYLLGMVLAGDSCKTPAYYKTFINFQKKSLAERQELVSKWKKQYDNIRSLNVPSRLVDTHPSIYT
jgi:hypothetical protein